MKKSAYVLILLLLLPVLLIVYRVTVLGYPLVPAALQKVWQLALDAHIVGDGSAGSIQIGLPAARQGGLVMEEKIGDAALDFNLTTTEGLNCFGIWSGRPDSEGVPDIRIIVYRGVPVMGMVRLPTMMSDGKANLHRGAIGAGIDIAQGKTITAVCRSEVVTIHPDTGHRVAGIQVPQWEQVLLMAAKALDMTGLGYMGVDVVIDGDHGPLLLELNARPGLAIQIANCAGLRPRLDAVDAEHNDAFATPEQRVAWARERFGT